MAEVGVLGDGQVRDQQIPDMHGGRQAGHRHLVRSKWRLQDPPRPLRWSPLPKIRSFNCTSILGIDPHGNPIPEIKTSPFSGLRRDDPGRASEPQELHPARLLHQPDIRPPPCQSRRSLRGDGPHTALRSPSLPPSGNSNMVSCLHSFLFFPSFQSLTD